MQTSPRTHAFSSQHEAAHSTQLLPRVGRLMQMPPTRIESVAEPDGELGMSDLREFSDFLAKEFDYNQDKAIWECSAWYQGQVGSDCCSETQAVLLREMTIRRCGNEASRMRIEQMRGAASDGWFTRMRHWLAAKSPAYRQNIENFAVLGLMVLAAAAAVYAGYAIFGKGAL